MVNCNLFWVLSSTQFKCYIAIPICESLLSFRFGWMKISIILPHAVILLPPSLLMKVLICLRFLGYFPEAFLQTSNTPINKKLVICLPFAPFGPHKGTEHFSQNVDFYIIFEKLQFLQKYPVR